MSFVSAGIMVSRRVLPALHVFSVGPPLRRSISDLGATIFPQYLKRNLSKSIDLTCQGVMTSKASPLKYPLVLCVSAVRKSKFVTSAVLESIESDPISTLFDKSQEGDWVGVRDTLSQHVKDVGYSLAQVDVLTHFLNPKLEPDSKRISLMQNTLLILASLEEGVALDYSYKVNGEVVFKSFDSRDVRVSFLSAVNDDGTISDHFWHYYYNYLAKEDDPFRGDYSEPMLVGQTLNLPKNQQFFIKISFSESDTVDKETQQFMKDFSHIPFTNFKEVNGGIIIPCDGLMNVIASCRTKPFKEAPFFTPVALPVLGRTSFESLHQSRNHDVNVVALVNPSLCNSLIHGYQLRTLHAMLHDYDHKLIVSLHTAVERKAMNLMISLIKTHSKCIDKDREALEVLYDSDNSDGMYLMDKSKEALSDETRESIIEYLLDNYTPIKALSTYAPSIISSQSALWLSIYLNYVNPAEIQKLKRVFAN